MPEFLVIPATTSYHEINAGLNSLTNMLMTFLFTDNKIHLIDKLNNQYMHCIIVYLIASIIPILKVRS